MDCDRVNQRGTQQTRIINNITEPDVCALTKDKDTVLNEDIAQRNNPEILDAFKQNPYTQPLSSTF